MKLLFSVDALKDRNGQNVVQAPFYCSVGDHVTLGETFVHRIQPQCCGEMQGQAWCSGGKHGEVEVSMVQWR